MATHDDEATKPKKARKTEGRKGDPREERDPFGPRDAARRAGLPAKSDDAGNAPFSTRLPPSIRAALKALAAEKGLSEAELGRLFIVEKLHEAQSGFYRLAGLVRAATALAIAALSPTIELDEARAIVDEHLDPEPPVTP
jgi:hypothetical protein